MPVSIADYRAKFQQITDAVLASGPDIQDDLTDVRFMVDAARRIRDRTIKRFGLSGDGTLTDEQVAEAMNDPQVKACVGKLNEKLGHSGPFLDLIKQLVMAAMANPAFFAWVMTLFNKPATPA